MNRTLTLPAVASQHDPVNPSTKSMSPADSRQDPSEEALGASSGQGSSAKPGPSLSYAEYGWLHSLAAGNPRALETLPGVWGDRIYRFVYRLLGNREDAEDVVATTFMRVVERREELQATTAFPTWLMTIARNASIDLLRKKKSLIYHDPAIPSHEKECIFALTFEAALRAISEQYVDPIILCDRLELTAKEAAAQLGLSEAALKSRLQRGRRCLREQLECDLGVAA